MRRLLLLIAILALTGCSSLTVPAVSVTVPVPRELLQPCQPLPLVTEGDPKSLASHLYLTSLSYADCQHRHKTLSDAIKRREQGDNE